MPVGVNAGRNFLSGSIHQAVTVGLDALDFFAFGHTLIAGIGEYFRLFTVDQRCCLRHVVDVGGRAHHGVHQSRVGIHADVNAKGLPASW